MVAFGLTENWMDKVANPDFDPVRVDHSMDNLVVRSRGINLACNFPPFPWDLSGSLLDDVPRPY